jgi:hypothetical protein
VIAASVGSSCATNDRGDEDVLSKKIDEARSRRYAPGAEENPTARIAEKLTFAESCPKFQRCSAAYCPSLGPGLGGMHLKGERVCSYLLESVKEGGHARLRGYLPKALADAGIRDGLRLLNSTGPLKKALARAFKQGSRTASMERAASFKGSSRD